MNTKLLTAHFIISLSISLCVDAQVISSRVIDSLAATIKGEYNIPAIAVSVVKSDKCYYGVQGTTKIDGKTKVSLKSKFHLGSNSKAITSYIAMKMRKEGEINFDTKFIDLFPELKDSISTVYHSITLGDLLSHQAKVQAYTSGNDFLKIPKLTGKVSDKRLAYSKFVLNEKSVKKGTYSNAGYVIASLMLERASSQTFEQLVSKYLSQLELSCYFGFPNKENDDYPWGHWRENEQLIPLSSTHPYKLEDYMLAAGDIAMDIVDYSKFIQLHLQGLNGKDNHLTKEEYEYLHFQLKDYSYGWGNRSDNKQKVSYHDGSAGTYYCHTLLHPARDLAIIIMTNSADADHIKAIYKLSKLLVRNEKKYTAHD